VEKSGARKKSNRSLIAAAVVDCGKRTEVQRGAEGIRRDR